MGKFLRKVSQRCLIETSEQLLEADIWQRQMVWRGRFLQLDLKKILSLSLKGISWTSAKVLWISLSVSVWREVSWTPEFTEISGCLQSVRADWITQKLVFIAPSKQQLSSSSVWVCAPSMSVKPGLSFIFAQIWCPPCPETLQPDTWPLCVCFRDSVRHGRSFQVRKGSQRVP